MSSRSLVLFCFLLLSSCYTLHAQIDAHYWTHQYGAKGLLLNGAVIASSDGETALFYNPGSVGMDENIGFAFSFVTPTYADLTTTNLLGDGNTIKDTYFGLAPGFLGVRFKPFGSDKFIAGISTFTRYKTDIRFNDRVTNNVNDGDDLVFRADLNFERKISEEWVGFCLAWNLREHLGIGLSQFSIWHSQNTSFDLKKEIQASDEPSEIVQSWRYEVGYRMGISSGFITKLGLAYRGNRFNLGLTYTTPTYGILRSSASYFIEDAKVNTLTSEANSLSNRNDLRNPEFKSPSSIGFGLDITASKTQISLSTEYFSSIDRYKIIDDLDDSYDGLTQTTTQTAFVVDSKNQSVLNIAIGVQQKMSEKTTWVVGFRSDFNQNTSLGINNNPEYLGSVGHVYHFSGGTMLNLKKNQFSLGFDIGLGRKTGGSQLADLSNITPSNLFSFGEKDNVSSRFYSFMLFFTYDFIYSTFSETKG